MKKMTILALHLGYGGVEKTISDLVNMLDQDFEIEIISTYRLYEKPPFPIPEQVNVRYLLPHYQPNRKEIHEAIHQKQPLRFLKEAAKSIKILYLRRKTMIKAIKNCDSDLILSTRVMFSEWLSRYGKAGTVRLAQEHNHHNNNAKYIKQIVRSCRGIDYFLPVSQELTDFYAKQIHNGRTKVVYIPHSLDYFPSQPSDYRDNDVVSVGRLSPEKGPLELLDVFALIHERSPQTRLHLIGDGPLKEAVQEKITALHLDSAVIMYGFQKHEAIHDILRHCSVYVMTSWQESFGLVLLEAQSFALPCVAFDSAQGAHEIIADGENGYLIANRDTEAMAEKICALMNDRESLSRMGTACRTNAQKYTAASIRIKWLTLLGQKE